MQLAPSRVTLADLVKNAIHGETKRLSADSPCMASGRVLLCPDSGRQSDWEGLCLSSALHASHSALTPDSLRTDVEQAEKWKCEQLQSS